MVKDNKHTGVMHCTGLRAKFSHSDNHKSLVGLQFGAVLSLIADEGMIIKNFRGFDTPA